MSAHRRRANHASTIALAGALAFATGAPAEPAHTSPHDVTRHGSDRVADVSATGADLNGHGVCFEGFLALDVSHVLAGGLPHPLSFDAQCLLELSVAVDTRKLLGRRSTHPPPEAPTTAIAAPVRETAMAIGGAP